MVCLLRKVQKTQPWSVGHLVGHGPHFLIFQCFSSLFFVCPAFLFGIVYRTQPWSVGHLVGQSPHFVKSIRIFHNTCIASANLHHCTMVPLSTKSCLKSSKLRPISNGQFCHAISKNICLNVLGSKQPRELLVL